MLTGDIEGFNFGDKASTKKFASTVKIMIRKMHWHSVLTFQTINCKFIPTLLKNNELKAFSK